MDNKRKSNIPMLIIVVLVIALVVSFVKISSLESEINQVRSDYSFEVSNLRNEINAIYDNVDEMLEKQASLLSGSEYEYGALNVQDHTVNVHLTIIPKLISENMSVSVSSPSGSFELVKTAEGFSGDVQVPLFMEDGMLLMTMETVAGTQTEYLTDISVCYIWSQYLPSLYHCDISGKAVFGEGKYTLNGTLDINLSPVNDTPDVSFEKFVLVTTLNGKQIDSEDITSDVLNYQTHPNGVDYRDDYVREYSVQEGDELIILLQATDSMGYIHECVIHNWKEENGASAEALYVGEVIYDSEGKVLYGKGYQ